MELERRDFWEDVWEENVPRKEYINYVSAIAEALGNDDEPEGQHRAALAAEKVATYFEGTKEDIDLEHRDRFRDALRDALKLEDRCARTSCAYALWKIYAEVQVAVSALGVCIEESLSIPEDQGVDYACWAASRLGRIGKDAGASVPTLIKCLECPKAYLRLEAIMALGKIGKEAENALVKLENLDYRKDEFFKDCIETAIQRIRQDCSQ